MKKKLLILTSVFLLTACGGAATPTTTVNTTTATTTVAPQTTTISEPTTTETTLAPTTTTTVIPTSTPIPTYEITVDFEYDGVDSKTYTTTADGVKIDKPTDPEMDLYAFDGWYEEDSDEAFDFDTLVNDNLVLYPKFHFIGNSAYQALVEEGSASTFTDLGFAEVTLTDFSVYEGTDAYVQVSTPLEFVNAIKNAKLEYTTTWNDELNDGAGGIEQELTKDSSVKVIEILNDLELGYYKLDSAVKSSGVVDNFSSKQQSKIDNNTLGIEMSSMFMEYGMSQIKFENISNLLVFSKNGAKITHAGFKLTSDNNIIFRNLEFDELWQWEDSSKTTPSYTIGDYDVFGWAYFKIAFCGSVLIDHCTFGKSYDGQIDVSNPDYTTGIYDYDEQGNIKINKRGEKSFKYYTFTRAPYGANGLCEVQISHCLFNAGSADEDGYIYKMMSEIEASYQAGENKYLYYKALRDNCNLTFEQILYGIAIPQKKGFLCGDREDLEAYNKKLYISFGNCYFKNLEDRLPKVRGGFAWVYNSIIDSDEYYQVRSQIQNAKNINTVNSKYKCGLVSQGIVAGTEADVLFHNTIIKGVASVLKNNDSGTTAGYYFKNVLAISTLVEDGGVSGGLNATPNTLTTANFDYHDKTEIAFVKVDLEEIEANFAKAGFAGANDRFGDLMIYIDLDDYLNQYINE